MAVIKTTWIKALMPDKRNTVLGAYYKDYIFKTFIDNKGNKTFYLNGREITKEDGNNEFLYIRDNGREIKREDSQQEYSYVELIEKLMGGYDNYVMYIDDARQYQAA